MRLYFEFRFLFKLGFISAFLLVNLNTAFAREHNLPYDLPMSFAPCPSDPWLQQPEQVAQAIPAFTKIILVPGAGAKGDTLWLGPIPWKEYFSEYYSRLKNANFNVELHSVSETGNEGLEQRVEDLKKRINNLRNFNQKILLIGHSMGGLTARLALRDPKTWKRVVGVIQISTPNLGTDLADAIFSKDESTGWITSLSKLLGFSIEEKKYLREMTYNYASKTFQTALDQQSGMPPVFSIISGDKNMYLARPIPLLALGGQWIHQEILKNPNKAGIWGTMNDGVVPAYSQIWGTCLGWFKGSHAQVLGKVLETREWHQFNSYMERLIEILRRKNISE